MLTIRQAQLDALSNDRVADFERRMLEHLASHFPTHMQALGREPALSLVRHAVASGAEQGVVAERDVCKLASLMIAFGPDLFDKHGWALQAWSAAAASPHQRVDLLYDAALGELKRRMR